MRLPGYCGYRFDWETGLYNVRYRMYHPTLGRWMTRDPLGYVDGMNQMLYVRGNPVVHVDPEGLWTEDEARNRLRELMFRWHNNGHGFAARLLNHFLEKRGPEEYVPNELDEREVRNHGARKICKVIHDAAIKAAGGRAGTYEVNVVPINDDTSNVRWYPTIIDSFSMGYAYGGARLTAKGTAKVWRGVRRSPRPNTHESVWRNRQVWQSEGTYEVTLVDLYEWGKQGAGGKVKEWASRFFPSYDAAHYLETHCGYKSFYHRMTFTLTCKE